jgi:hypothetical protein
MPEGEISEYSLMVGFATAIAGIRVTTRIAQEQSIQGCNERIIGPGRETVSSDLGVYVLLF